MRDKAFEEAVLNVCVQYGIAIARCALCGRLPKIDFRWTGATNNRVEAYCTGGRLLKRHTKVAAIASNDKEEGDGIYTEVVDMWNELNMKGGYVLPQEMPGRLWDDD